MKNYNFAFYISEKQRTLEWAQHLQKGAALHGDKVEIISQNVPIEPENFDGAAILGMANFCKRAMDRYLGAGKHFLYLDKGYMGRGRYWRVSVDSWQPLKYFQRFHRPDDRLIETGQKFDPFRDVRLDTKILLAGSCQNYANFMDLGDVNIYNTRVVSQLRKHTKREIVYRPNPSWYTKHNDEFKPIKHTTLSPPEQSFTDALKGTHLVVSHGTSAALTAMATGLPNLVLGPGIARPLSLTEADFSHIEEPFYPKARDRYQLFADLAYCQWTVQEFRSGEAWNEIRLALSFLEEEFPPLTMPELIQQYSMMHASPRYFRGLSTIQYTDDIADLVKQTESETVLDFGSGKGEQYESTYRLQDKWGVKITCYDPAYPKFAKLPENTFDGVICCDVMEHIPEEMVPDFLEQVISKANKFVFFGIATTLAKKGLPDGRNCHVTVKPYGWWHKQIRDRMKGRMLYWRLKCVAYEE